MNFDHLYSGDSLQLILHLRQIIGEGPESEVFVNGSRNIHPMEKDTLPIQWRNWLKECGLRKQELEDLEYGQWLREEREKTIEGLVSAHESSPAHLFHELLLPLIRAEINDLEHGMPDSNDVRNIRIQVLELVKKGRIGDALELVTSFIEAEKTLGHRLHDVIHLQSELAHLNNSERKGLLSLESSRTARNQVLNALLGILDELNP